jgi:hypothetical protein
MNADYERIAELVGTIEQVAKKLGFYVTKSTVDDPAYNNTGTVEVRLTIHQKDVPGNAA